MSNQDFRIPLSKIAGVPQDEKAWKSVDPAHRAYGTCAPEDKTRFLKSLTPGQRALIAVGMLRAEIDNGGFGQYFWNSSCELAPEAIKGLKLIGAKKHAKVLSDALSAGKFQKADFLDPNLRRDKLKRLRYRNFFGSYDNRFYDLDERPADRLDVYVQEYYKAHSTDFHISDHDYIPFAERKASGRQTKEYRVKNPKISSKKVNPEEFTWKLIESVWDDYWEELKAGQEGFQRFVLNLSPGQRALIAIDILNKTVLRMGGVLGFVAQTACSEILCEEVTRGYSLLLAKPYQKLWSDWLLQVGDLPKLATEAQQVGRQYANVRDTQGKDAATDLSKQYMSCHRAVREREHALRDAAQKINDRFKRLLDNKETAIEVFIVSYVTKNQDQFFVSRR